VNSVTINLTRLDYAIAQFRMQMRHPVNIGAWLIFGGWMGWFSARATHHPHSAALVIVAVIISVVSFGLLLLPILALVSIVVAFLARRERGVLGEHKYTFTDAGLAESTSVNENLIKWGGARAILRTRRYVYVRTTLATFHTIPRRFFADAAADEGFWNALQPLVIKKNS